MTALTAITNAKTTDSLPALHTLTVAVPANGTALITRMGDKIGDPKQGTIAIAAGETKAFGPFATTTWWEVECTAGTATVTVEPADFPAVDPNAIERMVKLTQAEYDALSPDSTTLYVIVG